MTKIFLSALSALWEVRLFLTLLIAIEVDEMRASRISGG